jgi:hypothetical protein
LVGHILQSFGLAITVTVYLPYGPPAAHESSYGPPAAHFKNISKTPIKKILNIIVFNFQPPFQLPKDHAG